MPEPTEYLVLERPQPNGAYFPKGTVSAFSAESAIRKTVEENDLTSGTYVAVPKRSFREVHVKTETQTRIVLDSLEPGTETQ